MRAPAQRDEPSRKPLYALMYANTISLSGNQLALLALPWYVLQTTGSAGRVGMAGAVEAVAIILSAFFGGALVDRTGFRRSSVLADCASGLAILLIPLLDQTIGLAFWQLLVLIFLVPVFNTPGATARNGLLPDLAELAAMRLERATSVDQVIKNGVTLGGPLLAGVLIAGISASNVLWIDAASFALSALLVALFIPERASAAATEHPQYFDALREGISFIRAERLIRSVALLGTYVNMVGSALMGVLLPVLAKRVFGSSVEFGILIAADGGGALLGTLAFGAWGDRWPRRPTMLITYTVSFVALALLAMLPSLPIMVVILLVDGAAFGVIGTLMYVIYQERIPAELRGRVFGSISALHRLGSPAGVLIGGYAIQIFSLTSALGAVAFLSMLMPIIVAVGPAFRSMERRATADTGPTLAEVD